MKLLRAFRKPVAPVLAFAMILVSAPIVPAPFVSSARAAMVGTDEIVSAAGSARDRVSGFLAREDVRAGLERLGVPPDEATARVGSLSDAEVAEIAGRIDSMPAGGEIGPFLLSIVIIFLIPVITDLMGWTNVYGLGKKQPLR